MKLGMICYEDFGTLDLEILRGIREKGLSFAEFCVNVDTPPDAFLQKEALLVQAKQELGLGVGSIGRWGSFRLSEDATINETEFQNDCRLIDLAARLETPVFVAGCNYAGAKSAYENLMGAVAYFERLLDHAKGSGVKIAVCNCDWNNFLCADPMRDIVLGHLPELCVKFDASHSYYAGRDYLSEIKKWGSRIAHMHIKGGLIIDGTRFDDPPAGLDQLDWNSIFATLYAVGFQGNLSIEPHSDVWKGRLGDQGLDYTIRYIQNFLLG